MLDEAETWAASILAADQAHLAQHFARSVPPLVQWDGIAVLADDPRLLAGAVGWIVAAHGRPVRRGRPCALRRRGALLEPGPGAGALVYVDRRYASL